MQDARVGAAIRAVRTKRRWRQIDVANRAGVSRGFVSLVERGHLDAVSLATLRRLAQALDVRIDVVARWRGGELDRLLNAGHSALHESVALFLLSIEGWTLAPEVSFSIWGERGVIDILAWHAPTRSLLVIELKTSIVDINELVGGVDRKRRLARQIAAERGWDARSVSSWVIVSRSKTNQRRIDRHHTLLRAAFPQNGHQVRAWLGRPVGAVDALSLWSGANPGSTRPSPLARIGHRSGPEPRR
jgi:transcriptional regulator with XRE-family HTH domain